MVDPIVRAIYYFMLLEERLPKADTDAIMELVNVHMTLSCTNYISDISTEGITTKDVIEILLQHLTEKANDNRTD